MQKIQASDSCSDLFFIVSSWEAADYTRELPRFLTSSRFASGKTETTCKSQGTLATLVDIDDTLSRVTRSALGGTVGGKRVAWLPIPASRGVGLTGGAFPGKSLGDISYEQSSVTARV